MEDIQEILLEEEEHQSPLPPLPSTPLPPIVGEMTKVELWMKNKKAAFWKEYEIIASSLEGDNPRPMAKCKYCSTTLKCHSKRDGTSSLNNHLHTCAGFKHHKKDKGQRGLDEIFVKKDYSKDKHVIYHAKDIRKAIVEYIVLNELSFRHIDSYGFRKFLKVVVPWFECPSRVTIAKDIWATFLDEKEKLKSVLIKSKQRVCLTTDTWTSNQNLNYMALTAHFIDEEWNLHKRILNFCVISGHSGEEIGKAIETCLLDWGIERVFTVTMDNASANGVAIRYLQRRIVRWKQAILDGKFIHMRCCAHILNLIVSDGIKELQYSIDSVRNAVSYVRSSPSRNVKFQSFIESEKIEFKGSVCLDVPIRWNSTYLMLDCAIKFKKVFEVMKEDDEAYRRYFQDRDGPPSFLDWENALVFVQFLKAFHEITLSFSGSLHVTSNVCYNKIGAVEMQIARMTQCGNNDVVQYMATSMKFFFDKYWGGIEKINPLMLIAVVLDPRYKLDYLRFIFDAIYPTEVAFNMEGKVKEHLRRLYDAYLPEGLQFETTNVQCDAPVPIYEHDDVDLFGNVVSA